MLCEEGRERERESWKREESAWEGRRRCLRREKRVHGKRTKSDLDLFWRHHPSYTNPTYRSNPATLQQNRSTWPLTHYCIIISWSSTVVFIHGGRVGTLRTENRKKYRARPGFFFFLCLCVCAFPSSILRFLLPAIPSSFPFSLSFPSSFWPSFQCRYSRRSL